MSAIPLLAIKTLLSPSLLVSYRQWPLVLRRTWSGMGRPQPELDCSSQAEESAKAEVAIEAFSTEMLNCMRAPNVHGPIIPYHPYSCGKPLRLPVSSQNLTVDGYKFPQGTLFQGPYHRLVGRHHCIAASSRSFVAVNINGIYMLLIINRKQ
jgi:hypothetical protein